MSEPARNIASMVINDPMVMGPLLADVQRWADAAEATARNRRARELEYMHARVAEARERWERDNAEVERHKRELTSRGYHDQAAKVPAPSRESVAYYERTSFEPSGPVRFTVSWQDGGIRPESQAQ